MDVHHIASGTHALLLIFFYSVQCNCPIFWFERQNWLTHHCKNLCTCFVRDYMATSHPNCKSGSGICTYTTIFAYWYIWQVCCVIRVWSMVLCCSQHLRIFWLELFRSQPTNHHENLPSPLWLFGNAVHNTTYPHSPSRPIHPVVWVVELCSELRDSGDDR